MELKTTLRAAAIIGGIVWIIFVLKDLYFYASNISLLEIPSVTIGLLIQGVIALAILAFGALSGKAIKIEAAQ